MAGEVDFLLRKEVEDVANEIRVFADYNRYSTEALALAFYGHAIEHPDVPTTFLSTARNIHVNVERMRVCMTEETPLISRNKRVRDFVLNLYRTQRAIIGHDVLGYSRARAIPK